MSHAIPCVSARASPPAIGITYRSPSRSNTSSRPSGLTSSAIHVPSRTSSLTSVSSPGGSFTSHFGASGSAFAVLSFGAGVGLAGAAPGV